MKKVKQAKIPKGCVEIVVRGSAKEKGHLRIRGVVPSWLAGDIIVALVERSIKPEGEETRPEKKEKGNQEI